MASRVQGTCRCSSSRVVPVGCRYVSLKPFSPSAFTRADRTLPHRSMIIYASTLAYVVDGNPGKSTSAVATNSIFRGVLACISSQVSESILDKRGNGAFYTGWAILLAIGQAALVLVSLKGKSWREKSMRREEEKDEKQRVRREERLRVVIEGR